MLQGKTHLHCVNGIKEKTGEKTLIPKEGYIHDAVWCRKETYFPVDKLELLKHQI